MIFRSQLQSLKSAMAKSGGNKVGLCGRIRQWRSKAKHPLHFFSN